MIDLDPSIVDQESIRKARRKKMFLIALIPIIVLLCASAIFLRPGIFDMFFSMAYSNANADGAISISQFHKNLNIIEQFIAPYNAGTAYLKDNDGAKAEPEFRESLQLDPPKYAICQIRVNLSYSIEIQGDKAKREGDFENALVFYNKSEGVLYEDGCASKKENQDGKDEKATAAKKRISEKRSEAVASLNGAENNGGGSDSGEDYEITEQDAEMLRGQLIDGSTIRDNVNKKRKGYIDSIYNIKHW